MLVPNLYLCHQVEQSRREDERRDAHLWRLLRGERKRERSTKETNERPPSRTKWVRELLGSPGL